MMNMLTGIGVGRQDVTVFSVGMAGVGLSLSSYTSCLCGSCADGAVIL